MPLHSSPPITFSPLRFGNEELAKEVEDLMFKELEREAAAFKYVRSLKPSVASDTALLKLAAILTHNVGDVDQGLNYWQVLLLTRYQHCALCCIVLYCVVLYCAVLHFIALTV